MTELVRRRTHIHPKWSAEPIELPTMPLAPLPGVSCRTTLPDYWCEACREPRARGRRGCCNYCGGVLEHVPELAYIEISGPVLPRAHKALPSGNDSDD